MNYGAICYSGICLRSPGGLACAFGNVPRAPAEARLLVEDLWRRLRNDRRTQAPYIERAEAIEQALNLPEACQTIDDLGVRDTFPFEDAPFTPRR